MFNNEELENVRAELDNLIGSMVYQQLLQQEFPSENLEFEMENPNEEEYYDEDDFFNWKGINDFDYDDSDWEEEFSETENLTRPRHITPGHVSDAINVSMCSFWHQVFNALFKNDIMPSQLIPPEVLISNHFMLFPIYPQQQSGIINDLDSSTNSNLSTNHKETTTEKSSNSNEDKKSKK